MKKVIAVTVAYNRVSLTKEQLHNLMNQTYQIDKFIIIDNSNNFEINNWIEEENLNSNEKLIYKKTKTNIGSAKGFNLAIKLALRHNPDYVWIMDDDTIPNINALEELIKGEEELKRYNEKFSFLASSTFGLNNVAMTVPTVSKDVDINSGYLDWYRYLKHSIVKIQDATFCSILIKGEAIKKVGLPATCLQMWVEDTEYTMRLIKYYGPAYLVGNSIAIHKRANGKILDLRYEENESRVQNYFYLYRNSLIVFNEYFGYKSVINMYIKIFLVILQLLFNRSYKYRYKKIKIIVKSVFAFLLGKYDKKKFNNRFKINECESEEWV